jgi:MarR family transcriptional regulator for hemolysin
VITSVSTAETRSSFAIYRDKGTTPEIRLTVQLVLAARRWRALLDEKLRPIRQSSARMEAMSAIINAPVPSSQIDIAKRLRIEGPTMTRMIDALDKDGLVERRPAPGDRRTKHLALTAKGEAALEEIFAIADPLRERLLHGYPPERIAELTQVFSTLLEKLDTGLPDDAGEDG